MTEKNFEKNLFMKSTLKVNTMLKIIGLSLNVDCNKFKLKDLRHQPLFCLSFTSLVYDIFGQFSWLVKESLNGRLTLVELTFVGPCLTMCMLGCVKSFFFVKSSTITGKLIKTLGTLHSTVTNIKVDIKNKTELYMQSQLNFLNKAINTITILDVLGVIAFSVGPIIISVSRYYVTGEIELLLPFQLLYPFNPFNIRVWPFVYVHQIWSWEPLIFMVSLSAVIGVFSVLGPDSLFHTSCVLLNVKFFQLKQEIEVIFDQEGDDSSWYVDKKSRLADVIARHKQLLSSAELIESIYSESTLCNVLTSSLLICFTGFNVMAYDSIVIITPFISFLLMVIGQIFLLCFYGDLIQKSSGELSDAVYNSLWYREKTIDVRSLMIIAARSRKPCKVTAFGYADINIQAFTKIMSTAWSYLAVLLSFHKSN